MTHQNNFTFSEDFIDKLIVNGFDGIPEMFHIIMNNAIKDERETRD